MGRCHFVTLPCKYRRSEDQWVLAGFVLLAVTGAKSRRGGVLLDQEEVRHYLDELIVFFIR